MRKQVDIVNHVGSGSVSEGTSTSTPTSADTVLDLVHTVMHGFRSLQYRATRDGLHAVTHMESKVMGFFARRPGATLSDLAQHSGRDKAQLARLVKGLRERALLVAEADAVDRRQVHLALSDPGHAVQRSLRLAGRALTARAVDGLSDAEQAELIRLLEQVKANLDADPC